MAISRWIGTWKESENLPEPNVSDNEWDWQPCWTCQQSGVVIDDTTLDQAQCYVCGGEGAIWSPPLDDEEVGE